MMRDMDDGIRFQASDLLEIVQAFAQIFVGIAAGLVAAIAFLLLMLLTGPVGPATMAAIASALMIRSIVQLFNDRDERSLVNGPDSMGSPPLKCRAFLTSRSHGLHRI